MWACPRNGSRWCSHTERKRMSRSITAPDGSVSGAGPRATEIVCASGAAASSPDSREELRVRVGDAPGRQRAGPGDRGPPRSPRAAPARARRRAPDRRPRAEPTRSRGAPDRSGGAWAPSRARPAPPRRTRRPARACRATGTSTGGRCDTGRCSLESHCGRGGSFLTSLKISASSRWSSVSFSSSSRASLSRTSRFALMHLVGLVVRLLDERAHLRRRRARRRAR